MTKNRPESDAINEQAGYPLTPQQLALWLLYQRDPENTTYNTGFAAQIVSEIDLVALRSTFELILDRHPALRTVFLSQHGEPRQQVEEAQELFFVQIDASTWTHEELNDQVLAALKRPFNLEKGPFLRVFLFTQQADAHVLLISIHHIVTDGWSFGILLNELRTLYPALCVGPSPNLAEPKATYADYEVWLSKLLPSARGERMAAFWHRHLAGELPLLDLPMQHKPPFTSTAAQRYHGASCGFTLSKRQTEELKTFAQAHGFDLHTICMTAYQALLHRYSGQSDFLVGTAVSNRLMPQFARLVGYLSNIVVLRSQLTSDESDLSDDRVVDTIRRVQRFMRRALLSQSYPFPILDLKLRKANQVHSAELLQAGFNFWKQPAELSLFWTPLIPEVYNTVQVDWGGLVMKPWALPQNDTIYDLYLELIDGGDRLSGAFKYRAERFDADTIERMTSHFQILLAGIVNNPQQSIAELPLLTESERHQLLVEWNDTAVDFGEPQTIHAMFEQQVEHTPDDVALIFEDQQLTYRELNTRANQLAHHLIELGTQPDTLVAVAMERSIEMIVSLLAVLKAGGAYVPIDPTYPSERIRYMLTHSAAPIVLTQSDLSQRAPWVLDHESGHVTACPLGIAVDRAQLDTQSTQNPSDQRSQASCDQLAYVIYTSGSTGQPKGIAISHHNVANFLSAMELRPGLIKGDRLLALTTISFDIAVLELFLPLVIGASVVIASGDDTTDPQALIRLIQQHQITVAQATPATWTMLTSHPDWQSTPPLKVLCGGEALPLQLAKKLLENAQSVWNMYGPTEATVWVSVGRLEKGLRRVTIAPPIANTTFYILDDGAHVVPIGVGGELHIGGDNLARGYLNRPDLTSERFIEHPEFGRLYKTGDLCRWLLDGNIEFMGRTDFQVKIRGFRIELGEIENVLLALPGVREAVVLARENNALRGDKRLVAYFVPKGCSAIGDADSDTLQQYLAQRLPDYMVPSAFVKLKAMPLTPNGKLDRRALPAPDYALAQTAYVPPRNAFELKLADIWAGVLGVDKVGIHDNFFALGGHSLLATQVISRVRAQLNLEVPLKTLFETPQLAAFAEAISQTQTSSTAVIRKAPRRGQLPLSFAQQRLWFLDQLEADSAFYNIPMMVRLQGVLDVVALERSIAYLISRHESLRTTFDRIGGQPIQVIHDPTPFTLSLTVVDDMTEAQSRANKEAETPFNLRQGPLLRTQLLKIGKNEHVLLLNMHHIISDGWSIDLFMKELSHAYTAYAPRNSPTQRVLPELPIQYADFALWQRSDLSGDRLETLLSFWREHLDGAPALLELPTDRPRPPVQSYRGATYTFHLKTGLTKQLNQLAVRHDTTLFMLLLASFNVLLSRHSKQTDVVVGTPIANRNHAEIEDLIGCFVNTLALRTTIDDNPTFTELLYRVRDNTLAAYEHQDLPFEQLVDELQLERSLSYSPLFQVMFALQNTEISSFPLLDPEFGPLTATLEPIEFPFAKFDLTLNLIESSERQYLHGEQALRGVLEYNTDLFDEDTIVRMASHFTVLLDSIVAEPDQPVFQLPMLTDAEYHQMVHEWNDTAGDFGEPQTVHAMFELQAERVPNAVALEFDEHQPLTYQELNTRANQLAHYLIELGGGNPLGADTLVAIVMERSPEMVVALLAVLKAGGAYLPIDPSYPQARIRYMLADSAAPILLTSRLRQKPQAAGASSDIKPHAPWLLDITCEHIINVDQVGAQLPTHNPQIEVNPEQLAYVIYTSGSTGQPKGVMISHQALARHIVNISTVYGIMSQDRVLQFAAFSFDAAQEQIFTALCNGAALLLRPNHIWTAAEFEQQVANQAITVADLPPAYFQQLLTAWLEERPAFLDLDLGPLRLICLGGEKVPPEIVRSVQKLNMPSTRLLNVYGPTEATITATYFDLTTYQPEIMPTNLPIGKPLLGRKVYILDDYGQPVPVGVFGELYIGGDSLARGYLNRPDLTAERFIKHRDFARLYKTGDLCRWLPDTQGAGSGNIEFMGRTDFQVKIRGFRIELGEIESALLAQDGVHEAVVLARDVQGDKRLVGYIVPIGHDIIEDGIVGSADSVPFGYSNTLRQQLAQNLPDYMVPSAFVTMNALPLTPNGKVNRRALPAPTYDEPASHHVPAETLNETQLLLVWQNVLGVHPIGVEDNFFELGGHSLLATQLVHQMRQTLGRDISLQQLFQTPTIRGLLQGLYEKKETTTSFVPLRTAGSRTPLFLIHAVSGVVFPFSTLLPHLSSAQPIYALQARGIYDELPPFESLNALVSATIQEMKRIQPDGPYAIGGWSFGGMVAFEIARQLTQQGDEVSFLGVMDSYPPMPDQVRSRDIQTPQEELQTFFHLLGDTIARDDHRLPDELLVNALEHEQPMAWLLDQISQQGHSFGLSHTIIKRIWRAMKRNRQLMETYQPQPYEGLITLFCAQESAFSAQESAPKDGTQRWQALTEGVDTVSVSGGHYTMLDVAHVETLGRELEKRLQQIVT